MDFTLKTYKQLLQTLKDAGYRFITFSEYVGRSEDGRPKTEDGRPKTEDRRRETEDRRWKTGDRSKLRAQPEIPSHAGTEDGRRKTGDRRRETEDQRQKTEDQGWETEDRRPKTEDRSKLRAQPEIPRHAGTEDVRWETEVYHTSPVTDDTSPVIILRHDVDLLPQNSLAFARIQHEMGIRGSYYFRAVPESWDEAIIKEIHRLGHEVGYHYEDLDLVGREGRPKTEDGRGETEDRRPETEDGRGETEDRRPKTEDRSKLRAQPEIPRHAGTEDQGWETEDRRPKTEDRSKLRTQPEIPRHAGTEDGRPETGDGRWETEEGNPAIQQSNNLSHYNDPLLVAAIASFTNNLEKLRQLVPVKTICMHGSPRSKYDNRDLWKKYDYRDFGILGEPYFDVDFDDVFYLTDTGRRWDGWKVSIRDKVPQQERWVKEGLVFGSTFDILKRVVSEKIKDKSEKVKVGRYNPHQPFPDRVMFTFHPQRWTDKPIPWLKEYIMQNVKNVVKRLIVSTVR